MPIIIGSKQASDYSNPIGLLSDCHRRIEHFLKVLVTVAAGVRGQSLTPEESQALQTALRYFREAAPNHTLDEEESLFPRLRATANRAAQASLAELDALHQDHLTADAAHAEVEQLVGVWLAEGKLASGAASRLAEVLDQLGSLYQKHIAIEDDQVFPLAGETLSAAELEDIGKEMAKRRGADLAVLQSILDATSRKSRQ